MTSACRGQSALRHFKICHKTFVILIFTTTRITTTIVNWPQAWNVIFVKTDTVDVLLKSQQKPGLNRPRIVPPCSHYHVLTGLSLATTDRVIIFLFSLSKTMETFTFPLAQNCWSIICIHFQLILRPYRQNQPQPNVLLVSIFTNLGIIYLGFVQNSS